MIWGYWRDDPAEHAKESQLQRQLSAGREEIARLMALRDQLAELQPRADAAEGDVKAEEGDETAVPGPAPTPATTVPTTTVPTTTPTPRASLWTRSSSWSRRRPRRRWRSTG